LERNGTKIVSGGWQAGQLDSKIWWGVKLVQLEIPGELYESHMKVGSIGIPIRLEVLAGFNQTSDSDGSQAKDAQDIGNLGNISGWIVELDQTASIQTDDGDLFHQTVVIGGFEIRQVGLVEAASVETVFEGVDIAGLTAAVTFG